MNHLYILINLNLEDVTELYEYELSSNPSITWGIVLENPKLQWNAHALSSNPNITLDIIMSYQMFKRYGKKLDNLCCNPNITLDTLPEGYSTDNFSENPNLTWEIIQNNKDKDWYDYRLSCHPSVTLELLKTSDLSIDDYSYNPNVTWEEVQSNPDIKWEYYALSRLPNITWDIIKSNPDYKWDYIEVCSNPHLSLSTILEEVLPKKNYEYNNTLISGCQNTTWKDIHYNKAFSAYRSFINPFQRWNASLKIQRRFRLWESKTRVGITYSILLDILDRNQYIQYHIPVELVAHISTLTHS